MNNKKIVLAGGSGFIGQGLIQYFDPSNNIVVLTRDKHQLSLSHHNIRYAYWDGRTLNSWAMELNNADLLINLAGKSVNCRYTTENKKAIFESRTNATTILGEAIKAVNRPPKVWINAASATIYRHAEDRPQDEFTGDIGTGFSVEVCQRWEKSFNNIQLPETRKVILRIAITLGEGSVMIPYCNLAKFGLGGHQGTGHQKMSWVHIQDVANMMAFAYENETIEGVYNCSAPGVVSNHTFMKTLRQATGNPFGLPAAKWMLDLGAKIIGTETELILKSRWVIPTRIQQAGFSFKFPTLQPALQNILHNMPRKQYHLF